MLHIALNPPYLNSEIKYNKMLSKEEFHHENKVQNRLDSTTSSNEGSACRRSSGVSSCVCRYTICGDSCTSICHSRTLVSHSRTRTSDAAREIFSLRNSCHSPRTRKSSRAFCTCRRHSLVASLLVDVVHRPRTRLPFCNTATLKHQCQIDY